MKNMMKTSNEILYQNISIMVKLHTESLRKDHSIWHSINVAIRVVM